MFAPVALFLEAIDLVLRRLEEQGADFSKVQGISGAGMQHGTVFWSKDAESLLANLDSSKTLLEQLDGGAKGGRKGAFSHPFSPNWQDASTQKQCEAFDKALDGPVNLAVQLSLAATTVNLPTMIGRHNSHQSTQYIVLAVYAMLPPSSRCKTFPFQSRQR